MNTAFDEYSRQHITRWAQLQIRDSAECTHFLEWVFGIEGDDDFAQWVMDTRLWTVYDHYKVESR